MHRVRQSLYVRAEIQMLPFPRSSWANEKQENRHLQQGQIPNGAAICEARDEGMSVQSRGAVFQKDRESL